MERRRFIRGVAMSAMGSMALGNSLPVLAASKFKPKMRFGFVTYLWGKDMNLTQLIQSCEASGMLGVETRTEHAHGVEPELSAVQRSEVKKKFDDSPVKLVGYGSNAQYHEADPARLKANIELTKKYIRLMHDCGGTGVKVKPNGFPRDVPREKTIEQIGRALNEVARYGDDYGQEIRVEVHGGGTSDIPVMKAIFDVADHPNATICWNCNGQDLQGQGINHNFDMVKNRFGKTLHVRELDSDKYPYQKLFNKLAEMDYSGWMLLEARTNPSDKVAAMKDQMHHFQKMYASAIKSTQK